MAVSLPHDSFCFIAGDAGVIWAFGNGPTGIKDDDEEDDADANADPTACGMPLHPRKCVVIMSDAVISNPLGITHLVEGTVQITLLHASTR